MIISSSLLQGHLHQKRCYSMQLVHQFHWIQADLQTCCEEEIWALLCDVISQSYESKYDRLPLPHWQYDQQIKAPLLYFTQNLYLFIFSLYFLKSFFVYVGACLSKKTYSTRVWCIHKMSLLLFKQPSNGCGRRSACVWCQCLYETAWAELPSIWLGYHCASGLHITSDMCDSSLKPSGSEIPAFPIQIPMYLCSINP